MTTSIAGTLVEHKYVDEVHWFFGRGRSSDGIMVANRDLDTAVKEVTRQLKTSLENADVVGKPYLNMTIDDLARSLDLTNEASTMVMWSIKN